MESWQEDHLREFENAGDHAALFRAMARLAPGLGFEFCTHAIRIPIPLSSPSVFVTTTYSKDWLRKYQENNYLAIDPVVQHGLRSQEQLVWDHATFGETRDFYEEACAEGIRFGWTQACHGANNVASLVTLARSAEPISAAELQDKGAKLAWLAEAAQLGIARHMLPQLLPALDARLSNRETAVLRWTADGKNSEDIAEILRISKRTVDYHANNAVAKLGTSNRTAAAVLAAMFGMI